MDRDSKAGDFPSGFDVEYDPTTDVLIARGPCSGASSPVRLGCQHPEGPRASLKLTSDQSGRPCRLVVTGGQVLLDHHRAHSAPMDGPVSLDVEPGRGRLLLRRSGYTPAWDALYLDLVGTREASSEWADAFAECEACWAAREPFFGLCIGVDGRLNGIIIEYPQGLIRSPPDAEAYSPSDPRWPN